MLGRVNPARRTGSNPRRSFFVASGVQFINSVISAATLSSFHVDEELPIGGNVVLTLLLRVHAAAPYMGGKQHHVRVTSSIFLSSGF